MLRLTEIGLFLVPFALYVAWRLMGPRLPPVAVWLALTLIAAMAAATIWFGLASEVDIGEAYAPARLENGVIVGGHGIPK